MKHIAVIGDLMLDRYIYGEIHRMSQEAPVPIVEIREEKEVPGGAGNVAVNITSLQGKAFLVGVVGEDEEGRRLLKLYKKFGISGEGVLTDKKRITTLKTRIVVGGRHMARIDREVRKNIEKEKALMRYVKENMRVWDLVVISDYAKGCITKYVAREIIALAKKYKKPVIADTKPPHINYMKGATLYTPNKKEALEMTGKNNVQEAGKELQKQTGGDVVVTEGKDGMTLFEKGSVLHIPAATKKALDVSGAGDTVVAALALALANKWPLRRAARVANVAAGIAVKKAGTAAATIEELKKELKKYDKEKNSK